MCAEPDGDIVATGLQLRLVLDQLAVDRTQAAHCFIGKADLYPLCLYKTLDTLRRLYNTGN